MRKRILLVIVVIVAVAAGVFWFKSKGKTSGQAGDINKLEKYTVKRGNIQEKVDATGTIKAVKEANLYFKGTGRVAFVAAQEGDTVHKGEVIASLEDEQQKLSVERAEASLEAAKAQLEKVKKGPLPEEIAAAKAAVESAKQAYRKLLEGPTADQIKAAKAQVELAKARLKQAQAAYDRVASMPNVGMLPQSLQLEQATINYEAALANYRQTVAPADAARLAQARAQIVQAESQLARLQNTPSKEDIEAAKAQVKQAEIALEQAKSVLDGLRITAPFSGTVALVNVSKGNIPPAMKPAVVLVDTSKGFYVDAMIDEMDVAQVAAGQTAIVEPTPLSGVRIEGKVTFVSPVGTMVNGVNSYKAKIELPVGVRGLKSNMSTNISIVTKKLENVLVVPNKYVRIDPSNGRAYVFKDVNGELKKEYVTLGAKGDQYSQVTSGLKVGDVLVLVPRNEEERLKKVMFGGG